jgi:hypothetical protein
MSTTGMISHFHLTMPVNGVNGEGEPIEDMRLGKEDVDAEPDSEVKHHAYHGSGDGRERRVEKPHAAQLLNLWRAKEDHTVEECLGENSSRHLNQNSCLHFRAMMEPYSESGHFREKILHSRSIAACCRYPMCISSIGSNTRFRQGA